MDTRVADQLRLRGGHLDFIGRSHIWIDDYDRVDSVQFAQFALANALAHTAPGQLEVLVFDDALRGIAAPFQEVNSGGEKILRYINDLQELNETIK